MHGYERKARDLFGDRLVNKGLARTAGLPRLPQYVVEWLVANYVHAGFEHEGLRRCFPRRTGERRSRPRSSETAT